MSLPEYEPNEHEVLLRDFVYARTVLERLSMVAHMGHRSYAGGSVAQIRDIRGILVDYWTSQHCTRCGNSLNEVGHCLQCIADEKAEQDSMYQF